MSVSAILFLPGLSSLLNKRIRLIVQCKQKEPCKMDKHVLQFYIKIVDMNFASSLCGQLLHCATEHRTVCNIIASYNDELECGGASA